MVRRSRLEIYFDVLTEIEKGAVKPTQIMYHTYLSWAMLKKTLEVLIENGFVEEKKENKNTRKYQITDAGRSALSYYLKASDGLAKPREQLTQKLPV